MLVYDQYVHYRVENYDLGQVVYYPTDGSAMFLDLRNEMIGGENGAYQWISTITSPWFQSKQISMYWTYCFVLVYDVSEKMHIFLQNTNCVEIVVFNSLLHIYGHPFG